MKKLLFTLTLLSFIAVGCNRDRGTVDTTPTGTTDRQSEEMREDARGTEDINVEGQEGSYQEEQEVEEMGTETYDVNQ